MPPRRGLLRDEATMFEPSAAVPGRKKVVVVEDDPETRELELFLLGAEGYRVVGVADGETAAETIEREAADLVILDLMLPGKDGIQVLAELGRAPATATTPVIVVSAYAGHARGREALRNEPQVRRILEKPFDLAELLDAVAHELGPPGAGR
jgi:CheY-like chemotaxis protein